MTTTCPTAALRAYEVRRVKRVTLKTWAGEKPVLLNLTDWCLRYGFTLDQLDEDRIETWWWGQEWADSTRNTKAAQVREYFDWLVRHRYLRHDPSIDLHAPKPMYEPRERLTAAELLQLLEVAEYPQHRWICALAMNLAVRGSEMKTLRISDWRAGKVRVQVGKTRQIDLMPVTEELADERERWMAEYRRLCPTLDRSSFLVPGQYVDNVNMRAARYYADRPVGDPEDAVNRALANLGWHDTAGEGVHTIRRSMARIFYDAAAQEDGDNDALLATMRLLHHAKPETTLRYIGLDRQTEARDRVLTNPAGFLTRIAGPRPLALAQ